MRFTLLILVTMMGCTPSDQERQAPLSSEEALSSYYRSVCRLFTEPACIDSQRSTCRSPLAFDSPAGCQTFFTDLGAGCPEVTASVRADLVTGCVAELDAFTCGAHSAVCDVSGTRVEARGACASLNRVLQTCDTRDDTGR